MVVYWSIKSAADLAAYAVGATDKFKGTGVFSSVEFQRESKDERAGAASNREAEKKSTSSAEKKK